MARRIARNGKEEEEKKEEEEEKKVMEIRGGVQKSKVVKDSSRTNPNSKNAEQSQRKTKRNVTKGKARA
jgi:hypothetical protein